MTAARFQKKPAQGRLVRVQVREILPGAVKKPARKKSLKCRQFLRGGQVIQPRLGDHFFQGG